MSTTGVTVTVHFIGICTNISKSRLPELPAAHRIVLVNASKGSRDTVYAQHPIGPHTASIAFDGRTPMPLKGCTLTLTHGAAGMRGAPQLAPDFHRLPNLTALFDGAERGRQLSVPSREVVIEGKPDRAACYFDVQIGTLTAQTNELGSISTTLTATGPHFLLEARPFEGGSLPEGLHETTVLTEDTTIVIGNTDTADKSPVDFILHYLTAQDPPVHPPIPDMSGLAFVVSDKPERVDFPDRFPPRNTVGAGCSNSNYP
jgi:hypothetical protein